MNENVGTLADIQAHQTQVLAQLLAAARATMALWNRHGLGDDGAESDDVHQQMLAAIGRARLCLPNEGGATNVNMALLMPDTLASIVADLQHADENGWAKSRDLPAIDDAKVALAELVGIHDADLLILQATERLP